MLPRCYTALVLGAVAACACGRTDDAQTVLVTGATGGTGKLVYNMLADPATCPPGWRVTALVRNLTKAKEVLKCGECTEQDGVFVGDVTKPETLPAAMKGATILVVATSSMPKCPDGPSSCYFPKGGQPIDVDYHGGLAQLKAFAAATSGKGHAILISSRGTTEVDGPFGKVWSASDGGHVFFYKLNLEAWLMSSGLASTVIKPCGLDNSDAGKLKLLVGHDDEPLGERNVMSRGDVARFIIAAAAQRSTADGQRIDICAVDGQPQSDKELPALLQSARWPWEATPESDSSLRPLNIVL